MTRARERLLLSGAVDLTAGPIRRSGSSPISWLVPALSAELPQRLQAGPAAVFDQALDGAGGQLRVRVHAPPPQAPLPGLEPPQTQPAAAVWPGPARVVAVRDHPIDATHVRGASVPRQPPETLSYTALSQLQRCGYRYYLERVLGMPERRDAAHPSGEAALGARARGILAHRLLEHVDFRRPQATSDQDVARAARELSLRADARERAEIAALVSALSGAGPDGEAGAGSPGARVAAAISVHREHPFAFSLGPDQPLLSGVIDLLAHEAGGGALVLDYKTDALSEGDDVEALVARDYAVQRLLYALAVLRAGASRVEIVHWYLHRPRDWVSASYDNAQRPELEELLRACIAAAWRFEVSAHPRRALCESCPGRGTLCSYEEAVTLAP